MADFPGFPGERGGKILAGHNLHGDVIQYAAAALVARAGTAWPSADLAIFVPVLADSTFTIAKFAVENGSVSGLVDVGLYTAEGQLVISSGSTAQAGAAAWQVFDVTDTTIPPGVYYLAVALNNGTGQVARFSAAVTTLRSVGVMQMASAFPLPTTATFAAMAQAYFPMVLATSTATV